MGSGMLCPTCPTSSPRRRPGRSAATHWLVWIFLILPNLSNLFIYKTLGITGAGVFLRPLLGRVRCSRHRINMVKLVGQVGQWPKQLNYRIFLCPTCKEMVGREVMLRLHSIKPCNRRLLSRHLKGPYVFCSAHSSVVRQADFIKFPAAG